jgi:hypothetical protein
VRRASAEEHQRRLAAFDPGVVRLDQHGGAGAVQRLGVCAGLGRVVAPSRAARPGADGGLHHHLPCGQPHRFTR